MDLLSFFLEHGSYLLMMGALVIAGLGVPMPEDIVMIAGAVLVDRGLTDFTLTVITLVAGVVIGDSLLFFFARRVGTAVYQWKWMQRVMPTERRAWLESKLDSHGGMVVFAARQVAGVRGATFALAAVHGMSYRRFMLFDLLGLALSMPLWMLLGFWFSDSLDELMQRTATAKSIAALVLVGALVLFALFHGVKRLLDKPKPSEPASRDSHA